MILHNIFFLYILYHLHAKLHIAIHWMGTYQATMFKKNTTDEQDLSLSMHTAV